MQIILNCQGRVAPSRPLPGRQVRMPAFQAVARKAPRPAPHNSSEAGLQGPDERALQFRLRSSSPSPRPMISRMISDVPA